MSRCALLALAAAMLLFGCAPNPVVPDTAHHITAPTSTGTNVPPIPAPTTQGFALPRPKPGPKQATHSVVVRNVKVQDLLFALARDARINVDIHPGITGTVTLNALDQTLPQLLNRIALQVDMRHELHGDTLIVMPDTPFLRHYKIDYVNLSRDTSGTVSVTTEIASTSTGATQQSRGSSSGNNSQTRIENTSHNRFWDTLIQNLKDLLRETDKIIPQGTSMSDNAESIPAPPDAHASDPARTGDETRTATAKEARVMFREAASVIANPETGVISIRATSRQHEKVQEFLDRIQESARREVLIEATIVEVQLSEGYQQGIDWSKADFWGSGFNLTQTLTGGISTSDKPGSMITLTGASSGKSFSGTVKLLESFGTVKVLSSPKISVLNNQTAVLKVVDNRIYFTITTQTNMTQTQTQINRTSTAHSVSVGLVLSVTPQIGSNDSILLNIRPSLSRIFDWVNDPNPDLKDIGFFNKIPVIRSREFDSVIRVENNNIAIMGGLMEDAIDLNKDTVPLASRLPLIGGLFQNRNDIRTKNELVILLRPTIIRRASLQGDYRDAGAGLPGGDVFSKEVGPSLLNLERLETPPKP